MKEYIVSQKYIDGIYTDEGSTFGLDMQKELIRCKDCKRCQNSTVLICGKPKEIFYCDGARKMAVAQYDYCSWAERKEE